MSLESSHNEYAQTGGPRVVTPPGIVRRSLTFRSGNETLAADLTLPDRPGPHPALLNIAGTGSQNRNGDVVAPTGEVALHGRDRWVADRLAQGGIATLHWDKRGVGESTGGDRKPCDPPGNRDSHATLMTDVQDAESGLHTLREHAEIDPNRITVMGHSAGVLFACLLAARTDHPACYILWGGVHRGIGELMEYIFEQIARYAARGPEQKAWVMQNALPSYRTSQRWREVLAAAKRGDDYYDGGEGNLAFRQYLGRLKQELAHPLYEQFRHVQKPTLVIHGDRDENVTHEEAFKIYDELKKAGNQQVTLVIVPGADHSMHIAPPDMDAETRLRERLSRSSYRHPFSEFFIQALIGWMKDQFKYQNI